MYQLRDAETDGSLSDFGIVSGGCPGKTHSPPGFSFQDPLTSAYALFDHIAHALHISLSTSSCLRSCLSS